MNLSNDDGLLNQPDLEFEERLTELFSKDIYLNPPFEAPSRTVIGQEHLGVERFIEKKCKHEIQYIFEFFRAIIGWIEANPTKKNLGEAIKSVYEWSEREEPDSYNLVNTIEGHSSFLMEISKKNLLPIFLVAPKGSGKTFYLNYILNNYTSDLYDKGIIWYRADLAKVYEHKIKIKQTYTVKDYIYVQIVYVTFKYRNSHSVFKEIWSQKNKKIIKLLFEKWNQNKEYREKFKAPDDLLHEFKAFVANALKTESRRKLSKGKIYEFAESNNLFLTCRLLAEAIIEYLESSGFRTLIIVDSLDNIKYHKDRVVYERMIDEISLYAFRDDKFVNNEYNLLLSMRDETYAHLRYKAKEHFNNYAPVEYRIKEHNLLKVLQKKASAISDAANKHFSSKRNDTKEKIRLYLDVVQQERKKIIPGYEPQNNTDELMSQYFAEFIEEADRFITNIKNAINSSIDDKENNINEITLLRKVYNNNLRLFLNNFVNILLYKMFFKDNKPKISSERGYVIIEGQFLNGMLYLDSLNNMSVFGKCIPNIFYFDENRDVDAWHGLCGLRILQFVKTKRTVKEVTEYLSKHFMYDKNLIEEILFNLMNFGLIDCVFVQDSNDLYYVATEKAQFTIKYIFNDLNIMYNLALDTPMNTRFSDKGGKNYIDIHSNVPRMWEYYPENCILASLVFIRHILTRHNDEIRRISPNERVMFALPARFPEKLRGKMIGIAGIVKNFKDTTRYENLLAQVKGMV
ncbi:hypothetical protein GMSM_29640 [Geomonas sp. Red276]